MLYTNNKIGNNTFTSSLNKLPSMSFIVPSSNKINTLLCFKLEIHLTYGNITH